MDANPLDHAAFFHNADPKIPVLFLPVQARTSSQAAGLGWDPVFVDSTAPPATQKISAASRLPGLSPPANPKMPGPLCHPRPKSAVRFDGPPARRGSTNVSLY